MIYKFGSFQLHQIDGYIADLYLIEYEDSVLIPDCGCREDFFRIKDYICRTINKSGMVKLIVVTHLHPDHAGSYKRLKKYFRTPVAAHSDINLWYSGTGGRFQHFVDSILAHIAAGSRDKPFRFVMYPFKVDAEYRLRDSDTLPFFKDWLVLNLPGHTTHDILLYNKKEKFLYCSDTVVKIRDKFLPPYPVTDKETMKASLDRLSGLDVKAIALAHGGVIENADLRTILEQVKRGIDEPLNSLLKKIYPFTLMSGELKRHPAAGVNEK